MRPQIAFRLVLISMAAGTPASAQTCQNGASVCYAYDNFGRLATATYANGTILTYTYDNTDNILSKTVSCPNTGC